MIIELVGGQFVNQGAALMIRAVADRVRVAFPEATFAMGPGPWAPKVDRQRAGLRLKFPLRKRHLDLNRWSYGWPKGVYEALAAQDLVVEGAVGAVLDLSGYAYGDRWGALSLEAITSRLNRARRFRRPYVFLPPAFEPFKRLPLGALRAFGGALSSAAYVAVRDAESGAALEALCPSGTRILRVPDLTIGHPGDPSAGVESGVDRGTALIIPNVRMLDSGSDGLGWDEGYIPLLRALAAAARNAGLVPRVLNHSGREDRALAESLGLSSVIEESDPVRTKGIIGAAGLVISSRYHGCVSALSQGVPCLATSWSHKYQALFDDFRQRAAVLLAPDPAVAIEGLNDLLARRSEVERQLTQESAVQAFKVEAMWQEVLAILGRAALR